MNIVNKPKCIYVVICIYEYEYDFPLTFYLQPGF